MKRTSLPLLPALLGLAAAASGAQIFTLQDAVTRALEHNPELAVYAPALAAGTADVTASRAGYRPRIDFEQSYSGGNNPVYVFGTLLTQQSFGASNFALPSLNRPDPIDNLQTRVTALQTIWDGGRTRNGVRAAGLGLQATERSHDDHVRQVLLSVLDAYYSVSLAREAWEASKAALHSAEAISTQAELRVETGLAVEADALRSQAHLATARRQEIQSRGELEVARAGLNRMIGSPLDFPFGDTAALAPVKFTIPAEDALLTEQRAKRPDYRRLLLELSQAELDASSRRTEFLPSLSAFGAWEADNPSLARSGGTNWTAGLSLRWNIYAGGGDSARLQAARHRVEQKRREIAAMESAMTLEIRREIVSLQSAAQQVEVTRAAEAQAQESLRILKNRYEAGMATMTDLLSAESLRAGARMAFAEAVYRHRLSFARLEYAAGILSPTSEAMKP
jgi:outer membrane protein TolC